LFEDLLLRKEVLAVLRKDPTLSETDREFALQLAQTHSENARQLNEAAWKVVKTRDGGKDAYSRALRQAEAAVKLAPRDGNILNTLGVAQYRVGRYADSLATLTKTEKLNATKKDLLPTDLAFLAMTQHQLGKKDEAKATLGRLREIMKQSRWVAQDAEYMGFLREARELIEGKSADKKDLAIVVLSASGAPAPTPEISSLGAVPKSFVLVCLRSDPQVIEELKLSKDQVKKIEELQEERRKAIQGLSRVEAMKKSRERTPFDVETLHKFLTKKQLNRACWYPSRRTVWYDLLP
jgi:tetratricopeptide (TPR) repeat protein